MTTPSDPLHAVQGINTTDGIPSEIYVAIGRGRYDGTDGDEYDLAKDLVAHFQGQLATERAARERAEGELKAKESAAMLGQYMLDTVECLCESGYDRDSPRDKQIDGFISAWQKLKAERDAAFRECAKWSARCGEAEGKLQGSELAGVVRDWQERAEAAESRLAKVGELVESSFAKADEERLQETYKARDEAEKWKSEGDMYGWNFHQGMSSGTIGASIIYHRMKRELEAAMKGE